MLLWLPGPLLGALMLGLLVLHTLVMAVPVYAAIGLKLLTPRASTARDRASHAVAALAQVWAWNNLRLAERCLDLDWSVRGPVSVRAQGQYLVCANHQSWNDILLLFKAFGPDAPFFKFFLKRPLIWVPVLGGVWWGLDYPFMRRYTREQLEQYPELRGRDLETTRRACAAFRRQPALVLNFLEGTRFTPAKHQAQASPYRRLLRPRAGGIAFALAAMGDRIEGLIDVTIAYPDGARGFWDFLCGRTRRALIERRSVKIPVDLRPADYDSDPAARAAFQAWIAELWGQKDARIAALLAQDQAARSSSMAP